MSKTTIEWTHMPGFEGDVWNPTTGCTRVSAGCDNCYAFALHDKRFAMNLKAAKDAGAHRMNAIAQLTMPETIIARARTLGMKLPWPRQYDKPFSQVQLLEGRLDDPLRVRKPTCYFVDSMADLFHEDVPDEYLMKVFATMERATWHRFLILTKRPQLMRERLGDEPPLPNVWLGTSVEDQAAADLRIPHLLATPAAVRFLSCEPLLGEVDLDDVGLMGDEPHTGAILYGSPGIDWVIAGGESGARARPMNLSWARSLRDQCAAAGVSFFMKQFGADAIYPCDCHDLDRGGFAHAGEMHEWPLRESHGRDMAEWPADLRIRTWPQVREG